MSSQRFNTEIFGAWLLFAPLQVMSLVNDQQVPAGFPADLDLGPARTVGEDHDDRIRHLVDVVFLLAIGVAEPGLLVQGENQVAESADVIVAEFF